MRLRIATFNVENLDDDDETPARLGILRPQLKRLDCDVLCFQEVNAHKVVGARHRELTVLDRLFNGSDYGGFHRAATSGSTPGVPRDRHNLVTLSRWPIISVAEHFHDIVPPPSYNRVTDDPDAGRADVTWDRPALHTAIALPTGATLHAFNLHLKSPLAANVEGQKLGAFKWASSSGWAEGCFLAAMKRAGQALETRIAVDRLLAADREALIAVCGDMNAEAHDPAMRILGASVDDTGNDSLAGMHLLAAEAAVDEANRFTVLHMGSKRMLDHILASCALHKGFSSCQIHNEDLKDEVLDAPVGIPTLCSFHAPIVAEYEL